MNYAQMLGLKFAYASNGHSIVEHNFITGEERTLPALPGRDDLLRQLRGELKLTDDQAAGDALTAYFAEVGGKTPRDYQTVVINRAVEAVIRGQPRILLTMATGTDKTFVAFQIVYRLWKAKRKQRILYLADRNVLTP